MITVVVPATSVEYGAVRNTPSEPIWLVVFTAEGRHTFGVPVAEMIRLVDGIKPVLDEMREIA